MTTSILDILGVTTAGNAAVDIDITTTVRQGLPIESFKRVSGYFQLSDAQLSEKIGTSLRTIVRLQKECKPLNPLWSDRLYRLARVAARAEAVFENAQTATDWLKRPNRALNHRLPVDLLDTDAGTEQVVELLERIEYGVYS